MKNKLVIDKNDTKEEVTPLLNIETNNKKYMIYTKNEKNNCGDVICYASLYQIENGKQYLEPITEESTLEFIDGILMHVQELMNKKESSE